MVDGNPLENIDAVANSAHHRLVIKGGKQVYGTPGTNAAQVSALAAAQ